MSASTILVLDTEVKPDYRFLGPEIARHTPGETEYRAFVPDPEPPALDDYAGVVLSGSTASVYDREAHGEWLDPEFDIIQECVAKEVPLLGVCFGHQAVNAALGGEVVARRVSPTTSPPRAALTAWWPKQTPSSGISSAMHS